MFFKEHFLSIADIINSKFNSYNRIAKNPADKGELCEIFIKEFLVDALGDSFKIFRGGRVINSKGEESKQIDIILTGKKTIKIFGDKGIYPTETVYGCISVTATLTRAKLLDCCREFMSIPKKNYHFYSDGYIGKDFIMQSINAWRHLVPYKCVFAYRGNIDKEWINDLIEISKDSEIPHNVIPDIIVVNKEGMIEKDYDDQGRTRFNVMHFNEYPNYGVPFAKILYHLNTLNWEELFLRPEINQYLNKDLEI
jgi:hypothetical protein